jgi:hypothetical protein
VTEESSVGPTPDLGRRPAVFSPRVSQSASRLKRALGIEKLGPVVSSEPRQSRQPYSSGRRNVRAAAPRCPPTSPCDRAAAGFLRALAILARRAAAIYLMDVATYGP